MIWLVCEKCGLDCGAESRFEAEKLLGTHDCIEMGNNGEEGYHYNEDDYDHLGVH